MSSPILKGPQHFDVGGFFMHCLSMSLRQKACVFLYAFQYAWRWLKDGNQIIANLKNPQHLDVGFFFIAESIFSPMFMKRISQRCRSARGRADGRCGFEGVYICRANVSWYCRVMNILDPVDSMICFLSVL